MRYQYPDHFVPVTIHFHAVAVIDFRFAIQLVVGREKDHRFILDRLDWRGYFFKPIIHYVLGNLFPFGLILSLVFLNAGQNLFCLG